MRDDYLRDVTELGAAPRLYLLINSRDIPMLLIAILATLGATVAVIATTIAYHIEAGDARRDRNFARLRSAHLRTRSI